MTWVELITRPAKYLSRRRYLRASMSHWKIKLCNDRIKECREDIHNLISAYECLIFALENDSKVYSRSPCSPIRSKNSIPVMSDDESSLHVQLVHSKLTRVLLLQKQLELENEHLIITGLLLEYVEPSIFRKTWLSDAEVSLGEQLVKEWVDMVGNGKHAAARALIREANEYSTSRDGDKLLSSST